MRRRILGFALLSAGIALGLLAYSALSDVDEHARFIAEVGVAFDQPIDAKHWAVAWRNNAIGFALLAVGGIVSGLGFIVRWRFSWAALAVVMTTHTTWLIMMRTRAPRMYAFEANWDLIAISGFVAMSCAWAGWRSLNLGR